LSALGAALRIIWDALLSRVRRREANNALTTITLMVAFHLPWIDVAYRAVYAVVLNIYIYLMNDYFDVELDLASPQKDQTKARFLAEHKGAAAGALGGLGLVLLGAAAVHSWLLVVALGVNSAIVLVYSAWLKRKPMVDVVTMGLWGVSMALVGLPAASSGLGWRLVGLLGLLCSCFEIIQVVRDEPGDRVTNIVTTAILLGARGAAWLFRALVVASAVYGGLLLFGRVPVAAALLVAAVLPLTPERADRTWDLCRLLFGAVWASLLAQVYLGQLR
jgi:4-hydroxybenzoate polyprenyltransferase